MGGGAPHGRATADEKAAADSAASSSTRAPPHPRGRLSFGRTVCLLASRQRRQSGAMLLKVDEVIYMILSGVITGAIFWQTAAARSTAVGAEDDAAALVRATLAGRPAPVGLVGDVGDANPYARLLWAGSRTMPFAYEVDEVARARAAVDERRRLRVQSILQRHVHKQNSSEFFIRNSPTVTAPRDLCHDMSVAEKFVNFEDL